MSLAAMDAVSTLRVESPSDRPVAPHSQESVTILIYDQLKVGDRQTIATLQRALHRQGIVGVKGIPKYKELVQAYIASLRTFSSQSDEVKQRSAPDRSKDFLGFEQGAEKFRLQDGTWAVDDSKASYYALYPDHPRNVWPKEVDLLNPFKDIGKLMKEVGEEVMQKIGLVTPHLPLADHHVGRMLHYRTGTNPLWCGAHFDHGLFTALLPAVYFDGEHQVSEPEEAGLFVKAYEDSEFRKVKADDPDVMLFQVGEFAQLATADDIHATEHKVLRAPGTVERYTMALFFAAKADAEVRSASVLRQDKRYGEKEACSYDNWHLASLARYHAK